MRKVQRGSVVTAGRDVATAVRAGLRQPTGGELQEQRARAAAQGPEALRAAGLKRAAESLRAAAAAKRSRASEARPAETTDAERRCRTNGDVLKDLCQYSGKSILDEVEESRSAKALGSSTFSASADAGVGAVAGGRSAKASGNSTFSASADAGAGAVAGAAIALPDKFGAPDAAMPKKPDRRSVIRQKILDALSREHRGSLPVDVKDLAVEIEEALHSTFDGNEKEYTAKARSVLFNLNDRRNLDFRAKLLVGFISPADVPHLSAEEMASHEKEVHRAKMRKESMEEIQTDWDVKRTFATTEGMFTCGRCKSTKTTYYQLQTRSSDEPMTTFVACLTCGKRWKC